jgi:hypothetical protein
VIDTNVSCGKRIFVPINDFYHPFAARLKDFHRDNRIFTFRLQPD